MGFRTLLQHSLKTRIALLVLALSLASVWALALYAGQRLRQDMRQQVQAQQSIMASLLAQELQRGLDDRAQALQAVAGVLGAGMEGADAAEPLLQQRLAHRVVLQQLFNGGTFITDAGGAVLASYPGQLEPLGRNHGFSDYVQAALGGQTVVGDPALGAILKRPLIIMATPVRSASGNVVGVLAGVVDLGRPNFIDTLRLQTNGRSAEYLVVARRTRTVITASDRRRSLEVLPVAGERPVLDSFINGAEGSQTLIFDGQTQFATVRQIPSSQWLVLVTQPSVQVFASLDSMRAHLLLVVLALTALIALGVWWLLRHELRPLEGMARFMGAMAHQDQALLPMRQRRSDAAEINQLVQGFNHLLVQLDKRQQTVRESELRYKAAFMLSPDALDITRVSDGKHLDINAGFEQMFGWSRDEVLGRTGLELGIWPAGSAPIRQKLVDQVLSEGSCSRQEQQLRRRDGSVATVLMSASLLQVEGEPCMLWVTHDVTFSRQAYEQIERLTSTDALTGLPNVRQLMQRLDQVQARCLEQQRLGVLLCLDLDDFKTVNDTLGHDHGDRLLQLVGERVRETLGPQDMVTRLSGDEFVVLLDRLVPAMGDAARDAERMANRLTTMLGRPISVDATVHNLSCSVGVLVFGQERQDPRELLRKTVLALNQAKHTGPGSILFFESQLQEQVSSRARLQRSLREALRQQNFALHYQPQLSQDGVVVGVEALVRWHLQGHGMVPPTEFIPLAEKTGLILPLGRWILHTACVQLALWQQQPQCSQLCMAVNVSAGQFQQDDFVQQVQEVLAETGAPAHRLKIELTESLMMYQIDEVIGRMKALRALGVRFSLDDFGTGFSSLAYLKRLPLDQLKIDQGFVRDILHDANDAAIARTVIALGESLGLEVIAEGVETQAHRDALVQWGCRFYQGYWFSKPLPADELQAYLERQSQLAM